MIGKLTDGPIIFTRRVVHIDLLKNFVITDNAIYNLGDPDKIWMRVCGPDYIKQLA